MNQDKIKNYLLIGAGIIIILLIIKIVMDKPVFIPQQMMPGGESGGKKAGLSPYHDHQVKNTILKNRYQIIDCYNIYIEKKPEKTDGLMMVDFEIDSSGEVEKTGVVSGGFGDETFKQCITDTIKKWQFPKPNIPAPVYVDHTFTFKKKTDDQQDKETNKKAGKKK